ncbi:plasmid pRiA4b ORF-3 family protein [Promicromonospora sp. NPDC023987]|uniref:plasmid pRiA4b ORF-3 family protein n=1 Tax=Promicromonospora sp. NPDC023987 TaxID=3155360 RepID=UPI0033D2ED40
MPALRRLRALCRPPDGEVLHPSARLSPPIWRRLELRSDLTLDTVRQVLQAAFGWTDSPEQDVRLDEVLGDPGDEVAYVYDYGDNWQVSLRAGSIPGCWNCSTSSPAPRKPAISPPDRPRCPPSPGHRRTTTWSQGCGPGCGSSARPRRRPAG